MCVNLDKFHTILLDKHKSDYTGTKRSAGSEEVQVISSVDLLSVINLHIDRICKFASNQLNALIRLKNVLGSEETKTLINSFVQSEFNYCPLVCMR